MKAELLKNENPQIQIFTDIPKQPKSEKKETYIQSEIIRTVDKLNNVRLFRNNTGMLNGIRFGLCVGSSDLIGFQSIMVTPEMIGQKLAVFTALEVKTAKGKATPAQTKFIEMVRVFGWFFRHC